MTNFEKTSLYDRMADFISIMDEDELRELAEVCKVQADLKQQERREHLRHKLMENLQKAIGDILHNGFDLFIQNTELNPDEDEYTAVYFDSEDIYHIEIE